jgi:hypothetical protein
LWEVDADTVFTDSFNNGIPTAKEGLELVAGRIAGKEGWFALSNPGIKNGKELVLLGSRELAFVNVVKCQNVIGTQGSYECRCLKVPHPAFFRKFTGAEHAK